MAIRYRKRIRIIPGVHINLSTSGVGLNIGVPGLNLSLGNQKSLNVGLPGSGISYKHHFGESKKEIKDNDYNNDKYVSDVSEDNIVSLPPDLIDSGSLQIINHLFTEVKSNSKLLRLELEDAKNHRGKWMKFRFISRIFLLGFIPPISQVIKRKISEQSDRIEEIIADEKDNYLNLDYIIDNQFIEKFTSVLSFFKQLQSSDKIWDINTKRSVDKIGGRTSVDESVKRSITEIEVSEIKEIKSNAPALRFCNTNGADIYLYPSFAVFYELTSEKFAAIRYSELNVTFTKVNFYEEGSIPTDAIRVGETWKKVNKDGSMDKRFKDNYSIPIVQYGQIGFEHRQGIKEIFQFSNAEAASLFYKEFTDYQNKVECVE